MGCNQRRTARAGKRDATSAKFTQTDLLRRALKWFATGCHFNDLPLHGNVGWQPMQLTVLGVLWAWSDRSTLTKAFDDARQLACEIFGNVAVGSYQGFTWASRKYLEPLVPQLWSHVQRLMQQVGKDYWRIGQWVALAVDGSRVSTPRTVSNEQAFAIKNYGHGKKAQRRCKWKNKRRRSKPISQAVKPQIWLTLIWHMGLKLPWCWRTGPSTASEREHVLELIETAVFPDQTLFCGDAGFVGYGFWKTILDQGHSFLIRVGGNVRLLQTLGPARQRRDLVYLWPDEVARRRQPPLVLRLLEFQGPRGKVYLVTNVLSAAALSLPQAGQLYRLRWGVELQFRTLKQTFRRGKLRSRTADNAVVELHWSLVGLSLVQLFAIKEQIKIDHPPEGSSVALALVAIQDAMRNWSQVVISPQELAQRLKAARRDNYRRTGSKQGRYRPKYKDKPCATKPILQRATPCQQRAYRTLLLAA